MRMVYYDVFNSINSALLGDFMSQEKKPHQWLSWLATIVLVGAASLASFVPEWYWHHAAFIVGNALWIAVGYLWKENSLLWLNIMLTLIYIVGLIV